MPLYPFRGKTPTVAPDAWVAPTATLIGDVTVASGASIWYGVTIRADNDAVRIGPRTNVQDNSVIHADPNEPTVIGADVTIGHGAIVHSSTIEDRVLIGMGAVVVGVNRVGSGTVVGAGAVLPRGMEVPGGKLVVGVPAKVVRDATPRDAELIAHAGRGYVALSRLHRDAT